MPHQPSAGLHANDQVYPSGLGYGGHVGPVMNVPHHSTQEQYDAWHQYGEQQETSYHEHQQGYGPNQWG